MDLFAGGCAITHCGMLSGKWSEFLVNDLNGKMPQMFLDAIEGKFANETRWISREDFFALKDSDQCVSTCWSFGNNCMRYLYGRPIEPYKKAFHYAVVFDDWILLEQLCPETWKVAKDALDGMPTSTWKERKVRRLKFKRTMVSEIKRQRIERNIIHNPDLYKALRRMLQNLESLERLKGLEQKTHLPITATSTSYEEYEFREGDVVYCDPPYQGTTAADYYTDGFDNNKFWEWVRTRDYPVYVSEYNAPDDFVSIFEKKRSGI